MSVFLARTARQLTTWVTFLPCFLWIFLGAPFIERLRNNRALTGAMTAITAAVVGVIANVAVWFALHVMFAEVARWEGAGHRARCAGPVLGQPAFCGTHPRRIAAIFWLKWGMIPTLLATSLAGMVWYLLYELT